MVNFQDKSLTISDSGEIAIWLHSHNWVDQSGFQPKQVFQLDESSFWLQYRPRDLQEMQSLVTLYVSELLL